VYAAVQAEAILLKLQHHGDDHIGGDGGDDQAVTIPPGPPGPLSLPLIQVFH